MQDSYQAFENCEGVHICQGKSGNERFLISLLKISKLYKTMILVRKQYSNLNWIIKSGLESYDSGWNFMMSNVQMKT